MAIERGFVQLITTGLNDSTVPGGFAVQLPENTISGSVVKAWTYRSILSESLYVFNGEERLTAWTVQIDCYGTAMLNAMTLSSAIDDVLSGGWAGTLSDPDSTVVEGIFKLPSSVDGFNDSNRTFVRTTEYKVNYRHA